MRVGAERFGPGFLLKGLSGLAVVLALAGTALVAVHAQRASASSSSSAVPGPDTGATAGKSGLPVPRFVSLKAGRVNVRVGPGEDYKIAWVFTRTGLPIEVIQEYDTWRRIRDSDGAVGWIFNSLLSGKRTAVVAPWASNDPRPVHARATAAAAVTAYLEPGVMASVDRCRGGWCRIRAAASTAGSSRSSSGASIPTRKSTDRAAAVTPRRHDLLHRPDRPLRSRACRSGRARQAGRRRGLCRWLGVGEPGGRRALHRDERPDRDPLCLWRARRLGRRDTVAVAGKPYHRLMRDAVVVRRPVSG